MEIPAFAYFEAVPVIVSFSGPQGSASAVARDIAQNQGRETWMQYLPRKPQAGCAAGRKILNNDIGLRNQPVQNIRGARMLKVQSDAFL